MSVRMIIPKYELVTADIFYWMPDHPDLLQEFVWQLYDLPPKFPGVHQFINFWQKNIHGKLHTVEVAYRPLGMPNPYRHALFDEKMH